MAFKDILIHLDNETRCETRLALAIGLARRYGAHLAGTYHCCVKNYREFNVINGLA